MGKYFGTDGIRGIAGTELTPELTYKCGFAFTMRLRAMLGRAPELLIARDTRISGGMLEAALSAGICAAGGNVLLAGVLPTPAAAFLCASCDGGAVISASHNPFEHNGIKLLGPGGIKLPDETELELESMMDDLPAPSLTGADVGRVTHCEEGKADEYVRHILASAPCRLDGLRLLIDCANGASSATAERIFPALGAECTIINCAPDGININDRCGSTHMDILAAAVRAGNYDLGLAFDGDADRCLACDENGDEIDGDVIMSLFARWMKGRGELKGGVAASVMSNLGLRTFLAANDVTFFETKVGDRYVLETMMKQGLNLGGEQSGHVILLDHARTGDGQLTGVMLCALLKQDGRAASALRADAPLFPQVLKNVAVPNSVKKTVGELPAVAEKLAEVRNILGERGRVLLRPSGTEALVRVMLEGPDKAELEKLVSMLTEVIAKEVSDL